MKSLLKAWLGTFGLEIRRVRKDAEIFPVELDESERALLNEVVQSRYSMASRERLFCTMLACRHVVQRGIEGDFVECGVWRGGNSLIAASVFRNEEPARKVYLFDTFAGMTPPEANDRELMSGKPAKEKHEALERGSHNEWCYASLEDVRGIFATRGFGDDRVSFVMGDVRETLLEKENLPEKISVLRLDTDWYESTMLELEILYPRLVKGGILIVDDYGHWTGSKEAVDKYFAGLGERPFLQFTDYTGRCAVKM